MAAGPAAAMRGRRIGNTAAGSAVESLETASRTTRRENASGDDAHWGKTGDPLAAEVRKR